MGTPVAAEGSPGPAELCSLLGAVTFGWWSCSDQKIPSHGRSCCGSSPFSLCQHRPDLWLPPRPGTVSYLSARVCHPGSCQPEQDVSRVLVLVLK